MAFKKKTRRGDIEVWEGCDRCIGGPFTNGLLKITAMKERNYI